MGPRVRTVYLIRSAQREAEILKPTVYLDSLKGGEITFGVRASGSSLAVARERAQKEFRALQAFVRRLEG